jgi:hypothetical protein
MMTAILTLSLALIPAAPQAGKYADRERHPLAPSLPQLTEKEEVAIEKIIDRFILYDTGRLKGAEGAKALADFKALGPEATLLLVQGLNKAAQMEFSCPAVLIGKKLLQLLNASEDMDLLDFARENIGAGVTVKRHMGTIKDLKLAAMLRKSALQRAQLAKGGKPGEKSLQRMSVAELAAAARKERGPKLVAILTELEKRSGPPVLEALAVAAATAESDTRPTAQALLNRHVGRQDAAALKKNLKHDRTEVRLAAVQAVRSKKLRLGGELIQLLSDAEEDVRQAARQALVQMSGGTDHGPQPGASESEIAEAVRQWQAWWAKQK